MKFEDDGFLDVEIAGNETIKLDVYVASDRFAKAIRDSQEDAAMQKANLAEAMAEFGIPEMSYRAHLRICTECQRLAMEGQKKDGLILPPPDAPGLHGTTS